MFTSSPTVTYLKDYKVSDFLIDHVDLTFALDETNTVVTNKMKIRSNPVGSKSHQLELNGEKMVLNAVAVNGRTLHADEYDVTENSLVIHDVPDECEVEIVNTINPKENKALSGLYMSQGKFTTQCEAHGFRRITYYLDRPDVMSTFTTTIIADEKQFPTLLSNGNPAGEGVTADGKRFVTWNDPFRKPSYLFALVAGDFDVVEDKFLTMSDRLVTLRIFAERGLGARCHHAMHSLKQAMAWDEKNFGRECDLDDYKIVAVSDYNGGAMENKGLNIFNTKSLLASPSTATDEQYINALRVIAHEYFHNWTGDRITVRDWFQLTCKEGLTSFRDRLYAAQVTTPAMRATYVKNLRTRQFPEDASQLAHPVQPQSYVTPDNFYTPTVYLKGAEIFRMLLTIFKEDVFRKAMDSYFETHDGHAITIDDFIEVMEKSTNTNLQQFKLWFLQAGTPRVTVTDTYLPDEKAYILKVRQHTNPTPGQPDKQPLLIPLRTGLLAADGSTMPMYLNGANHAELDTVLMVDKEEQEFRFENVQERPVPSLLRDFSAPVILDYDYSEQDYQLLLQHDKDVFNRLEASQRYIAHQLQRLIQSAEQQQPLQLTHAFVETFNDLLQQDDMDLWLLAEMITVPTEMQLIDSMSQANIDAIHTAREFLMTELALQLQSQFTSVYQHCRQTAQHPASDQFDMEQASQRRLQNQCLAYLMKLQTPDIQHAASQQLNDSITTNMTNTMAVLENLDQLDASHCQHAVDACYAAWQHDALSLDNWFWAQANAAKDINAIQSLMSHPKFNLKNPNNVNRVVGGFCENMACFHLKSGAGYRFLAEVILQIDQFNTRIASGFVKYLANWKRYTDGRGDLMRAALQHMASQKISKELGEMVSKSLGETPANARTTQATVTANGMFGKQKSAPVLVQHPVLPGYSK